jgi:hypothetical protein
MYQRRFISQLSHSAQLIERLERCGFRVYFFPENQDEIGAINYVHFS